VTGGDERLHAGLLLFWGVAAVIGNIASGRLVDRFDSRRVINGALIIAIVNFLFLPWTSESPATAAIALSIWGCCGWGSIVPQQHRLVKAAPQIAPLLLALNNTATYTGLACSGVMGGIVILYIDHHYLSWVGATCILLALLCAEGAYALNAQRGSSAVAT
jgi:predicted MFS family arabinose efflux permease